MSTVVYYRITSLQISTLVHFGGPLRFPLYQMPNLKMQDTFSYLKKRYCSGQHVPFCRENVQEDETH